MYGKSIPISKTTHTNTRTLQAALPTYLAIFKCINNNPAYNSSNVTSPDESTSIVSNDESIAFWKYVVDVNHDFFWLISLVAVLSFLVIFDVLLEVKELEFCLALALEVCLIKLLIHRKRSLLLPRSSKLMPSYQ